MENYQRLNQTNNWIGDINNDDIKIQLKNAEQIFHINPGKGFRRLTCKNFPDTVRLYGNECGKSKVFFKQYDEFEVWSKYIGATMVATQLSFCILTAVGKFTI